jgi:transposase
VVVDGAGRPICSEMWPGNVADVGVLVPMVDRLRSRFGVGRVCVVADRGMISAATIAALEERGLEYVLGVRERTDKEVATVLADAKPMVPIAVPRAKGETLLEAKEVVVEGRRYIVCRNHAEAARDAANRQAILDGLRRQLKKGDKALVGNSAYRRYLKTPKRGHFAIDEARVAKDAELDGLFVLRTNAKLTALQAMLRYRDLLVVEQLFRTAKSLLRTRPIYHQSDAAIRGHVFCSFLALVLRKELEERCSAQGFRPEWADVVLDLERLQEVEVEQDGKRFVLRTPTTGCVGKLFQAAGAALPPNIRELARDPTAA